MDVDKTCAITHVMEPVLPGRYAVLTVGGADENTRVYAVTVLNGPACRPGCGVTGAAKMPVELPVVQRKGECLTVDVPAIEYGILLLGLLPAPTPEDAVVVNRARIDWMYPSTVRPGQALRLIGRNFVSVDNYPTMRPDCPVSYGGLVKDRTRVAIRKPGAIGAFDLPVRQSSCYEVHLDVPADLEPGEYEVFAHSGLGGGLGWSAPFMVRVEADDPWPADVFPISDFMGADPDVDAAIAAALAAIEKNGGGVLQLAACAYPIRKTIVMPRRTVLRGAGMNRTMLALPESNGPAGPYVAITGEGDFAVEDLRIHSVYAPILVCAPTFVPETFDEAFDIPFSFAATRARNVAVRRCHLHQRINQHIDRRVDADGGAWKERMQQFVLTQGQGHSGFNAIHLKGDDLAVEECVIWGGGSCVLLPGCSHVRVARNALKAGPTGHAVYAIARLSWPEDNTGARIHGNYASEILIEDNDITAYSERARDLVYFIYGAENGHVARNRIADIECTFDAEGLGCHLWSAMWTEPTVRMTGPDTGEIVDPTGEVTHEWLEGACVYIVGGRGVGQLRRILEREGPRIRIDRPWTVAPDETSDVVFVAPPPFNHMTFIDNRMENTGVNIIVWGNSRDIVIDGNYSADAAGITVWSVRLAADQKVWGGAAFTTIMHSVVETGWSTPDEARALQGACGIFNPVSRHHTCTEEGFDFLGLVIRDNVVRNNTGIGIRTSRWIADAFGQEVLWRINEAGIVVERNHCENCTVGIAIERNAHALARANTAKNVQIPLVWCDAP